MYNPEWGEVYFQLTELKSERFKRFSDIERIKKEKKAAYDWAFVFTGLGFLLWIGIPSEGAHYLLYLFRFTVTMAAISFVLGSLILRRHIGHYEKLTSQIYELEKKLEITPQKKS